MDLKVEQEETKGSAYLEDEGKTAAEMTYSIASKQLIIIDHTDVNENYRGQQLGRQLLNALV
jgi:predicted GNAT family acetyltransferase